MCVNIVIKTTERKKIDNKSYSIQLKGENSMKSYVIESSISCSNEQAKEIVNIMKDNGVLKSVTGGFPLSPLQFHWDGTDDGLEKLTALGVNVIKSEPIDNTSL